MIFYNDWVAMVPNFASTKCKKMKSYFLSAMICLALLNSTTYAQTIPAASQSVINKTNKMKEFIFLVSVPLTYSGEDAKTVKPKWDIVVDKWKADNVFVTSFVFPGESHVVTGADRLIKKNESVVSGNRKLVSNIILRAASIENAVELAGSCPVLDQGGSIEVREILPRPVNPVN
jgi:hypothetical protein